MKNSKYWKQRFLQLENAQNKIGTSAYSSIEKQYRQAQKQIEGQISSWYQRFADNNEITLAEARTYLQGADLSEFKWDVNQYIQYGQDNAISGSWAKELENASAKFHISKLEALKIQTQNSLETMFAAQGETASDAMANVYKSSYYHTAYELQKGFNIGWDIAGVDQAQIEKILSKPWSVDGYNFSEKIWDNKEKLISTVHDELTQNILLGKDPQKAIDAIAKKMNQSKNNAGRLVMTEEAYFSSAAQKDCFKELGVEQYEIVATLDSHTSDICQSMDGKVLDMKDFQAGVTAPPFHPWCRSTTVPYFDDNFGEIGERAARDEETGKTYYVPDDMNYQQWQDTFVNGDKSDFDVVDDGSAIHYSHHVDQSASHPKKEYLTENKLKAKIAEADVQLDDLKDQANEIISNAGASSIDWDWIMENGGIDEIYKGAEEANKFYEATDKMAELEDKYGGWGNLMDHGSDEDVVLYDQIETQQMNMITELQSKGYSVDSFGNVEGITREAAADAVKEKAQLEAIQQQMADVTAQKGEWQQKLNEKLVAKEKKSLTKEMMGYEAQKAELQSQLDDFEIKTYSGIWKEDVTTADYASLNIEGKKKYYEGKFATETNPELMEKYQDLYNQLIELETEGKSYAEVQNEINKIEKEIQKVQNNLTKLENGGIIDTVEDAFTQDRKDAAYWFTSKKEADAVMRPVSGDVWRNSTRSQQMAAYDYTCGSGGFNRPLRGYDTTWSNFKGAGNVPLNNEGKEEKIGLLTEMIDKSSYDFDIWLQRGIDSVEGAASFLGITKETLRNATQSELEQLLVKREKVVKDEAFVSCGTAKGSGFNGYIFNVYAPKGTKMLYAEPFSMFGNGAKKNWDGLSSQSTFGGEFETIIQRGTEFRVTKVEKAHGNIYFDVEVVGQ